MRVPMDFNTVQDCIINLWGCILGEKFKKISFLSEIGSSIHLLSFSWASSMCQVGIETEDTRWPVVSLALRDLPSAMRSPCLDGWLVGDDTSLPINRDGQERVQYNCPHLFFWDRLEVEWLIRQPECDKTIKILPFENSRECWCLIATDHVPNTLFLWKALTRGFLSDQRRGASMETIVSFPRSRADPGLEAWRPVSCPWSCRWLRVTGHRGVGHPVWKRVVDELLRTCAPTFLEALAEYRARWCFSFKTLSQISTKVFLRMPLNICLCPWKGCLWGRGGNPHSHVWGADHRQQARSRPVPMEERMACSLKLSSPSLWGTMLKCWGPWPHAASKSPFGRCVQEKMLFPEIWITNQNAASPKHQQFLKNNPWKIAF